MENIRGWIGLLIFLSGVGMLFIEQTRSASWLALGFGMGMMASGFKVI